VNNEGTQLAKSALQVNRKNQIGLFIISIAIVALVGRVTWPWYHNAQQISSSDNGLVSVTTTVSAPPISSPTAPSMKAPAKPATNGFQEICSSVKNAPDAQGARLRLEELRRVLSAMPTNVAVAAIRQILDSRADSSTHLGFKVSGTGLLDGAPTLRTFLLDELARIDAAAAADYAKVVLTSMDSPDEWAVALRNLARGDSSPAGRTLLEQKTGELLRQEAWQQNPSVGFLEAFDVAVYLAGTNLMPTLSDLVRRQDNPAVAHAAFLALDRLVINNPTPTLSALQAAPDLMQGRELTRANYFARADIRDPQQRRVLENYLLNPQIGSMELDAFAGVYPNANFMISLNLLTPTPTPNHATLVSRDAESLGVLQDWLNDPRFANLRPQLEKARSRLEQFVSQAAGR
jgi:hypothetical protein